MVLSENANNIFFFSNVQQSALNELTHLPLDKMAAILQTIFSDAFLLMKSFVLLLKFH